MIGFIHTEHLAGGQHLAAMVWTWCEPKGSYIESLVPSVAMLKVGKIFKKWGLGN